MIAKLTKVLNIPHCEKCEKRRMILNEIQKVGVKETVRRLKAIGVSAREDGRLHTVGDLVKKFDDCCGK